MAGNMALIEFKDYPDTTTPTNAQNLNFNFNELNEKTNELGEKNYIQLKPSSDYTIAVSDTMYRVPFNLEMVKSGTKLSSYNNGVKIGNGVNHIKVTTNYCFLSNVNGIKNGYIMKNGTSCLRYFDNYCYAATYGIFGVSNFITNVQENDLITFDAYAKANDKIDATRTYITIEVLD